MKSYYKRAFSLLEISIVVLIIGVLVAGITQSFTIVKKFRLATARNLTEKSPVKSILGLELWLEPTMEKSFLESETGDGTNLSQWIDINNQKTSTYYALKTASDKVKYEDDAIGNIPSLLFGGTPNSDSYFTLSKSTSTSDYTSIQYDEKSKLTIFTVSKINDLPSGQVISPIFFSGLSEVNYFKGWGYGTSWSNGLRESIFGTFSVTSTSLATKLPTIASITFSASSISIDDCGSFPSGVGKLKIYVNGTLKKEQSSTMFCRLGGSLFKIGGLYYDLDIKYIAWNGYISEIIIFNKVLSDDERISVEKYLSQKYRIRLDS